MLQIQAAAHGRPARGTHHHALGTGFEVHAVLQLEIECAADIEHAEHTLPLVLLVEAAVGIDFQLVRLAAQRHAAAAVNPMAAPGAFDKQIHRIHHRRLAAAGYHNAVALQLDIERPAVIGRALQLEIELVDGHGFLYAHIARLPAQIGFDFARLAGHIAFGHNQAAQTEAEAFEIGGVDVDIEPVARLAEAAVGFDAVAAEQDIGHGSGKVRLLIRHIGAAAQRHAREHAGAELHFATENIVGQLARHIDVAVDTAVGKGGIKLARVEIFAVDGQLQRLVFKQLQAALGIHFTAAVGQNLRFFQQHGLLAERGVVLQLHQAAAFCRAGVELPRGFGGIKAAFHGDFAVEAAAEVLFERIGGHNILQQQRQIERLLIGVDAAGELELPFFQQLRGEV